MRIVIQNILWNLVHFFKSQRWRPGLVGSIFSAIFAVLSLMLFFSSLPGFQTACLSDQTVLAWLQDFSCDLLGLSDPATVPHPNLNFSFAVPRPFRLLLAWYQWFIRFFCFSDTSRFWWCQFSRAQPPMCQVSILSCFTLFWLNRTVKTGSLCLLSTPKKLSLQKRIRNANGTICNRNCPSFALVQPAFFQWSHRLFVVGNPAIRSNPTCFS